MIYTSLLEILDFGSFYMFFRVESRRDIQCHDMRLHIGLHIGLHGNPWIFGYFSGFLGYFQDFWSNIRVFGQNKVGIV